MARAFWALILETFRSTVESRVASVGFLTVASGRLRGYHCDGMDIYTFGKQLVCLCDLTSEIFGVVVLRSEVFCTVMVLMTRSGKRTTRHTHLLSFFREDGISCGYRVSPLHPDLGRMQGRRLCQRARTRPY